MSKIQPKRAYGKEIFEEFGGFQSVDDKSKAIFDQLINFRIASDGSLEKRTGWEPIKTFPEKVRGAFGLSNSYYWAGLIVEGSRCYLLTDIGEEFELPSEIPDNDTPVYFQMFEQHLLAMDGEHIYMLCENGLVRAVGYAPLYGLGWDPIDMGEVYEPLNLLSDQIRVNYRNVDTLTVFLLPFYSREIHHVYVDGKKVTDFVYGGNTRTLVIRETGLEVDIIYSISVDAGKRAAMQSCTIGISGEMENEPYMIFSGSRSQPGVFKGHVVPDARFNGSKLYFPYSIPLYFLESDAVVRNDINEAKALYRHGNHIYMFHSDGLCVIPKTSAGEGVSVIPLQNNVPCRPHNMHVFVDGDPLVLNENGLFRVRFGSQYDVTCTQIHCPFPELTEPRFADRAIVEQDATNNEIWFRDPEDTEGTVLVYQTVRKEWYRFRGIHAQGFFRFRSSLGVVVGQTIGKCSQSVYTDNGEPIEAFCETRALDFGEPESLKRTLRLSLSTETDQQPLEVQLKTETRERTRTLNGKCEHMPDHFDLRAAMGRFRHLRVGIRHNAPARFRIKRLALYANL